MNTSYTFKCDACGASSVTQQDNKQFFKCQYCGSTVVLSSNQPSQQQTSKKKLSFILLIIPVLVIALMVVFWIVFQNIRAKPTVEQYMPTVSETSTHTKGTVQPNLISAATKSHSEFDDPKRLLKISSQFSGKTSNGGLYWIVGVKNSGSETVYRPGAVVSMFDAKGQRVAEQSGWSSHESLEPNMSTVVLVFLSQPPVDAERNELTTLASKQNSFSSPPIKLAIENFVVSTSNGLFEIIGDVVNVHDGPVKYARVYAVAKNANDEPIGLGQAFATQKNLKSGETSGFKIKVGTFLVGEPEQWELWGLGRE